MKSVTQFQSDAGATFDNEHDAHRDDLRHWLCAAAGNDPIARQIADKANADIDTLAAIIDGMKRTAPVQEPELPLNSMERAQKQIQNAVTQLRDFEMRRSA